ncbi:MAG: ABC transporter ATP-binding protein/permease, partial [Planctomycetaceae bacterium]|nr:ABC transporter ATP-binding protein/permease [Planctomycetaceae bacterium]
VFFARVQYSFKEMDEAEGRMTAILQENLWGIRVVRAFARQEHERAKFGAGNRTYRDLWYRMIELMSWYWPISNMLTMGQQGLVLVVGGYFMARGRISIGTLYAYLAYVGMMLWPIRMLGRMLMDLGKALVSIGRVNEILDAPVEEDSSTGVPPMHSPSQDNGQDARATAVGRIVVRDLYFSHASVLPVQKQEHGRDAHATRQEHGRDAHATADAQAMVLEGVSLSVEPGQTLAIMGPSGSGKSTLVSLLLRFYDYTEGSITLDGVELSSLSRHEVRSRIGVVLQEPFLYSRTLRENIKHGRTRAADEEMIAAASAAGVHEAIVQFERGYDTLVGERGVTLSGGQRQRVAIARALLKDPPVLILDDALSSVDTQTEAAILAALEQRRGRRTTIVIAHRLATLMRADRTVVLDRGRVVQNGTHAELLQQDGLYRRLWEIQNRLDEDLATAEETA